MKTILLFLFITFTIGNMSFAQVHNYYSESKMQRKAKFRKTVKELKEGTLILKLRSNREKIAYLKSIGEDEWAQREKDKWDMINKALIDGFSSYEYSDFKVTYGYLLKENGLTDDIFLNENLEIDPSQSLKNGEILYTQMRGTTYKLRFYYNDHSLVQSPLTGQYMASDEMNNYISDDSSRGFFSMLVESMMLGKLLNKKFKIIDTRYRS